MPAERVLHRRAALIAGVLASGLAWGGAAILAERDAAGAEAAARATVERAAASGRSLLTPALDATAEALAATEARQAAGRTAPTAAGRMALGAGLQFAGLADASGRIIWATYPPLAGMSFAEREAYGLHCAGRQDTLLSPALLHLPGGPRSLLLTRPVADAHGGFAGIALVAIDPRRLERVLDDAALLPGLRLGLLRADGTLLATGG